MNLWGILDGGLDIAKMVVGASNPIAGGVIGLIDMVVEKKSDGVSNSGVMKMLESSARSTWNNLDEDKLSRIGDIIFEKEISNAENFPNELEKIQQELKSSHITTDEFYQAKEGIER